MDEQPGLTGDERAELERLRAENAVLRAQARRPDGLAVERGPAGGAVRVRGRQHVGRCDGAALRSACSRCWRRRSGDRARNGPWSRCDAAPGPNLRPAQAVERDQAAQFPLRPSTPDAVGLTYRTA